ncbi:MAG: LPS export ABC transporter permease LptG [Pseudomonadales bacterium]
MSKLGAYIAGTVGGSILLVLLLVVGLDVIAAIVDELGELRGEYTFTEAAYFVMLTIPGSIVEYVPLASLIGCLVGMGLLASNSELIVMRASGLSLGRLASYSFLPVLVIVTGSMLISEFVAPSTDNWAKTHKDLRLWGESRSLVSGRSGLWHREGETFMHFSVVQPGGVLYGVTLFEFRGAEMRRAIAARRATYSASGWLLEDVRETQFAADHLTNSSANTQLWQSELTPRALNFLANEPDELALRSLADYSRYLLAQGLDAMPFRLAFWQKSLQPLAVFSLVLIALSFVFGPLRSATMGYRVFIGIVVGIAFQFAQNLLGPASLIYGFPPLLAVLAPIGLCAGGGLVMLARSG